MVTGRPGGLILLPGDTSNGLGLGVKVERSRQIGSKAAALVTGQGVENVGKRSRPGQVFGLRPSLRSG